MPSRTPSSTSPRLSSPPKSGTDVGGHHFYNIPGSKKKYASVLDLASQNPLLYRISHRNSGSFYFEGQGVVASEHYFVGPESGERCLSASIEELARRSLNGGPGVLPKSSHMLDVELLEHVKYNKAVRTSLVSTTLSFTWALFFAEMNASNWKEEDVEILVISTRAVAPRAFIAQKRIDRICSGWYRDNDKRKVSCGTYTSQEVIVMNCIPESAIVSRVPWATLRQQLPPWFYYYKNDVECPSARRQLIPVPSDEGLQRHKRWRSAVQARLQEMPAICPAYEVVVFVMSVLSCLDTTPNAEMKYRIQCASQCMLSWSRNSTPSTLKEEELVSIIRSLSRERTARAKHSCYNTGKFASGRIPLAERRNTNRFLVSCGAMGNFKIDRAPTKPYRYRC